MIARLEMHVDANRNRFWRTPKMHRTTTATFLAFVIIAVIPSLSMAHAADSCQPVFDALTKVASTPNHSYTTHTAANGRSAEAETIFANGQKYIRVRGKWMRIPVTSQDVLEQEKEKEEKGKSTCQFLRSESVNSEAAKLYSMHRKYGDVKEEAQMWVSKSTGLLLRVEEDVNRGNNKKEHQSTHFEYGNIQAPM
jgi:hypothetical protein